MKAPIFEITGQGKDLLESLLDRLLESKTKIVGYAIREATPGKKWSETHLTVDPKIEHLMQWYEKPKRYRIVFFWTIPSKRVTDFVRFPFYMDPKGTADFASRWLTEVDYGKEPDTDGHNEKGWVIDNGTWGHVDDDHATCLSVAPHWITYGK